MPILPTPNMSLPVPVVGVEAGPEYATDVNACMTLIDAHNHAPGSGVQIDPTGLNINADLPLSSNNLTEIRTSRYTEQVAPLALATDLSCLYSVLGDMYWNDGLGNQVRLTQNGSVVGASGSITGLVSPATASYVSGTTTFVWESDSNVPANLDAGAIILRKIAAGSPGITLRPPTAIASDYEVVLPALPGANSFMTIDSSGNQAATIAVSQGVTLSMLAAAVQAALVPAATVLPYAGTAAPTGYLMCDGSAVSRTTYAALFTAIGITAGQGDGSTTFNVPDYRGRFLRGANGATSRDPDAASRTAMNTGGNTGNNVSSVQADELKSHTHPQKGILQGAAGGATYNMDTPSVNRNDTAATGGNETRPINAYVNFIIKT